TMTVLAYLTEGVSGLPVFAGATAGPAVLLGPTGGYLIGFIFAAYLTGYLAEKNWTEKVSTSLLTMLAGTLTIFFFGLAWLSQLVPADMIFTMGFVPFVPGAIVKILLATALLPIGWRWLK
ncbi:MAG: biotin transporter BioY, partial [Candidatus Marinimicrobia bacterium]|nr:biotin transporter BioY [Candidatus Neomarinimicrobiota bacterium]